LWKSAEQNCTFYGQHKNLKKYVNVHENYQKPKKPLEKPKNPMEKPKNSRKLGGFLTSPENHYSYYSNQKGIFYEKSPFSSKKSRDFTVISILYLHQNMWKFFKGYLIKSISRMNTW
jgi:hypothetical protein